VTFALLQKTAVLRLLRVLTPFSTTVYPFGAFFTESFALYPLVRDHNKAIRWAQDLLSRTDWVILDTETTGLDWTAEVISISVIAPDGMSLLETLVKPQEKISAEASEVNHITDEMVTNAPTFPDVYDRLCAVLNGKLVVAYNVDFDQRMIAQTACRYDLPRERIPSEWQCAMLTYAKYAGEWSDYFGSYRWQALPKGDHTAGGDCLATLELIQRMA
jgi:DNA polymerase-3 subunit epsilon